MSNILAFAGSNSSASINHQLLIYIQKEYLPTLNLLELRKLEIPMFAIDVEKNSGFPDSVVQLMDQIKQADTLLLSTSEHNGGYTSYFKTTIDWLSRLDREAFKGKRILIAGTSPGRGGAGGSIELSKRLLERLGAEVIATFSLPSYEYVFEEGKLIEEHEVRLKEFISNLD